MQSPSCCGRASQAGRCFPPSVIIPLGTAPPLAPPPAAASPGTADEQAASGTVAQCGASARYAAARRWRPGPSRLPSQKRLGADRKRAQPAAAPPPPPALPPCRSRARPLQQGHRPGCCHRDCLLHLLLPRPHHGQVGHPGRPPCPHTTQGSLSRAGRGGGLQFAQAPGRRSCPESASRPFSPPLDSSRPLRPAPPRPAPPGPAPPAPPPLHPPAAWRSLTRTSTARPSSPSCPAM